jgi:hypothetical protein
MTVFLFEATTFVRPGHERIQGEFSDDDRNDIATLRGYYPELSHWGDLAIDIAFCGFSRECLDVSWADWMLKARHECFLDYCCWKQTRGRWYGDTDFETLAQANEWNG